MCDIPGIGFDKLYLVRGLHSPNVQRRVVSKHDTWRSMEDVFQTINYVTRSKEWNRAFFKPNFEKAQPVIQVNKVIYGKAIRHNTFAWSNNDQPHPVWFSNNFRDTNRQPRGSLKEALGQLHYMHSPKKLMCYYLQGEHMVKDCIKLA